MHSQHLQQGLFLWGRTPYALNKSLIHIKRYFRRWMKESTTSNSELSLNAFLKLLFFTFT